MLLITLMLSAIAPIEMIAAGGIVRLNYYTERSSKFGYRTERSTASEEAWKYANRYCGALWIKLGLMAILPSLGAAYLMTRVLSERQAIAAVLIMQAAEAATIYAIAHRRVEKALAERFDAEEKTDDNV